MIVELNATHKQKKKIKRDKSLPLVLLKIEDIPKVEMPKIRKKVVVFAEVDTILGEPLQQKEENKEEMAEEKKDEATEVAEKPGSAKSASSSGESSSSSSKASKQEDEEAKKAKEEELRAATLKKMPTKSNLRKFNQLLEPHKKREIAMLSTLKRSNSYAWSPAEKPTIDNLWTEPKKPSMMKLLKQGVGKITAASRISNAASTPMRVSSIST